MQQNSNCNENSHISYYTSPNGIILQYNKEVYVYGIVLLYTDMINPTEHEQIHHNRLYIYSKLS